MDYTAEQDKLLNHNPKKPACILAGPGTGKSSTIISYIAKILKSKPEIGIRLLTFTRAANGELIEKVLEAGHEKIVSSTVHSFAISVLLNNPGTSGLPEPLRIADDWEWKKLIRADLARKLECRVKLIDKLKIEMSSSWESLANVKDEEISANLRARFNGMWEEHRRIFGYTLLSELPYRLRAALEANPDLDVGHLDLLVVDEYQDLNACDLECLKILSARNVILIAVGDDDQSIYQFRKAHPEGIRSFPSDFKAPSYPLTISHRCGSNILEWANYVIEGDTSRPAKKSLQVSGKNPEGFVKSLVFNRENSEAEGIVKLANWLINKKSVPSEEILILVRTNTFAKLIKETFTNAGVAYLDPSEILDDLKSDRSRELLAFLRLLTNQFDSLAWWTLLNLTRGIGNSAIQKLYELSRNKNKQFGEVLIEEFENEFANISASREIIKKRVNDVIKKLGQVKVPEKALWGSWIIKNIKDGKLPAVDDPIERLFGKMDDWKENIEQLSLGQFVNQIEPVTKDIMNSKTPNHIRIMTLSGSKGLTVTATIIAGAEKEIIPLPYGEYQEERRLLYVGMTRAQEYLFVTRARRRTGPTARTGSTNVAKTRLRCPFLDGGPVRETIGDVFIKEIFEDA